MKILDSEIPFMLATPITFDKNTGPTTKKLIVTFAELRARYNKSTKPYIRVRIQDLAGQKDQLHNRHPAKPSPKQLQDYFTITTPDFRWNVNS
jgi:hypothetical protein